MAVVADRKRIRAAEVVLPCAELDATPEFFTGELGLRLEAIFSADAPAVSVIAGDGLRLRLERAGRGRQSRPDVA